MLKSLPLPAVLVDIETTGGNVTFDRITEIGIIEIYEDEVREWSSLVNPGVNIPVYIQRLTGITQQMLETAPRFEQIAKEILLRLKDKLFIAHNVRFDYGFIRNEFSRLAYSFSAPLLCSVKLSRTLYAEHPHHGLDAIIQRHQIYINDRHRALGDARATYKFLQIAEQERGIEKCRAAVKSQSRRTSLPPLLSTELIDGLPDLTGVYYFWGKQNELLYIGKSLSIRKRILSHFSSDFKSSREMKICQQTNHITWDATAGELSALILESQKIKELRPIFNRRLRRLSSLCSILLQENEFGWLMPKVVNAEEIANANSKLYGLFPSVKKAGESIRLISDAYNLCYYATGLERRTSRPCTAFQLKKCKGLCAGVHNHLEHNINLIKGFSELALKAWPYQGPIALIESNTRDNRSQHFIINNWCLLGIAESADDYPQALNGGVQPSLDKDIYRYLVKAIFSRSNQFKIHVIKVENFSSI